MSGFRICDNKGFHITFANGYTVSVQFGGGNYCDNYDFPIGHERESRGMKSSNAEVAVLLPGGGMQEFQKDGYADTVLGRQTVNEVLALMVETAARPDWVKL